MEEVSKIVIAINRKDFGLTWNEALEIGGVNSRDEVAIALEIEMAKAQAK